MSGVRLDCEFCEETVRASAADDLKDRAVVHLGNDHRRELRDRFAELFGGSACWNDCGYVFPTDAEERSEFECPNCGHDNFEPFARRYVYWRIEDE